MRDLLVGSCTERTVLSTLSELQVQSSSNNGFSPCSTASRLPPPSTSTTEPVSVKLFDHKSKLKSSERALSDAGSSQEARYQLLAN